MTTGGRVLSGFGLIPFGKLAGKAGKGLFSLFTKSAKNVNKAANVTTTIIKQSDQVVKHGDDAVNPVLKNYIDNVTDVDNLIKNSTKYSLPLQQANIGRKLDYLFGKATGRLHNIERSTDMLRQMRRIGLPDTPVNREFMEKYLQNVLMDSTNIVGKKRGYTIRESLLMGPQGGVKVTTSWEGERLITIILEGG